MPVQQTNDIPEEMRKRIVNIAHELSVISGALQVTQARQRELKEELLDILDVIGVGTGESLLVPEAGATLSINQTTRRSLSRDALLAAGVDFGTVEQATLTSKTKPFVVLKKMRG